MSAVGAWVLLGALTGGQAPEPALWIHPDGRITIAGKDVKPSFSPDTKKVPVLQGWGVDFGGPRSGILLGDPVQLQFTDSFTVSTWIRARSYVNQGPGAQILFRGDDRSGHDPFTLVIHGDSTINFSVQNDDDRGIHVTGELPLRQWVHVVGSYEAESGQLRLWLNGKLIAFTTTSIRPFARLDPSQTPGVGIGNVQNNHGPHNQPFNGTLYDLRVYQGAWTPESTGFEPTLGAPPPLQRGE